MSSSTIFNILATLGSNVPWIATENKETINTMWNKSCFIETPAATAVMANTDEEAPRIPAQAISRH